MSEHMAMAHVFDCVAWRGVAVVSNKGLWVRETTTRDAEVVTGGGSSVRESTVCGLLPDCPFL